MSVLGKFRHKNGFNQLVKLLEISDAEKQTNLLRLVAQDDPGWARLAQIKMLTTDKVLGWPTDVLGGILASLENHMIAALLQDSTLNIATNVKKSLAHRVLRDVQGLVERKHYDEQEKFAARLKLVQTVREMLQLGIIDLSQVARVW